MPSNPVTLQDRIRHRQELFSILGTKPQDLAYHEIVERVAEFMFAQDKLRVAYAFGNEVGENLDDKDDARFDPIALYEAYPDSLDEITMFVEAEMQSSEEELLRRKDTSLYAYNTLVFAGALRLARSEPISTEMKEFLIAHLLMPKLPQQTNGRGRPKNTNDENIFKRHAIEFAVAHGLKPTRNDATPDKTSACDAVSDAGRKLYQTHGDTKFTSGYTFEALKKIWQKA